MRKDQKNDKRKAAGGNPAALPKNTFYSNKKAPFKQSMFDKRTLLEPARLLEVLGIRYRKNGLWLCVYCPFHKNGMERNPSLSMHTQDGYYKCHACGAQGADVIAFYRNITGASFKEALRFLGGRHA